ncbi:MAG: sensor histidine kinase [Novosphingobium sp.]
MGLKQRTLTKPVKSRLAGYLLAIVLTALALGIRFVSDRLLPPGFPFLTFFPAVILTAFLAGRGPAVLSAALSLLAAWYFFIEPLRSFTLNAPVATALAFFATVLLVDILLIHGLQQRQEKLVESQRELAAMAEQRTLLFKELQHRVANNLASISAMLRLQRRQIERDPAVALGVLGSADARIELMGRVHRQLYDPAAHGLSLPDQITKVVKQAQDVAGATDVTIIVEAVDARIAMDRLMTLMLLITEVLNNSMNHAFDEGQPGEVVLRLERIAENRLCLTISDNGRGSCPDFAGPKPWRGLGTTIIHGLAMQLGATLTTDGSSGMTTVLEFAEEV